MDYKAYLTQNVIPFWLKNGLDREKGGIYLYLDEKGKLYGDGTVANTLKGNISKGLFLLPRLLMQIYEIENQRIVF